MSASSRVFFLEFFSSRCSPNITVLINPCTRHGVNKKTDRVTKELISIAQKSAFVKVHVFKFRQFV